MLRVAKLSNCNDQSGPYTIDNQDKGMLALGVLEWMARNTHEVFDPSGRKQSIRIANRYTQTNAVHAILAEIMTGGLLGTMTHA